MKNLLYSENKVHVRQHRVVTLTGANIYQRVLNKSLNTHQKTNSQIYRFSTQSYKARDWLYGQEAFSPIKTGVQLPATCVSFFIKNILLCATGLCTDCLPIAETCCRIVLLCMLLWKGFFKVCSTKHTCTHQGTREKCVTKQTRAALTMQFVIFFN